MKYIFPAVFHPFDDKSGGYAVSFPDIPNCLTEGSTLEEALQTAHSALCRMLEYCEATAREINKPSKITEVRYDAEKGEFATLVSISTKDNTVVRKTVSLPKWMVDGAAKRHLSLSKVLQSALEERLNE